MEVIKLENMGYYRDDMTIPGDIFLLQVSITYLSLPFYIMDFQNHDVVTNVKMKTS